MNEKFVAVFLITMFLVGLFPANVFADTNSEACETILARVFDSKVIPLTTDEDLLEDVQSRDTQVANYLSLRTNPADINRVNIFSDISIGKSSTGTDKMATSINRHLEMGVAYMSPNSSYYRETSILTVIMEDFNFLYDKYYGPSHYSLYYPTPKAIPTSANWWALEIGIPAQILDTLIVLKNELPAEFIDKYSTICDIYVPTPFYATGGVGGANGIWITNNIVKIAALKGNPAHTQKNPTYPANCQDGESNLLLYNNKLSAVQAKCATLINMTTSGDGFYDDGSYIGHTYHAYSGGYGIYFYNDTMANLELLGGTIYAPSADKLSVLSKWTFDCVEPMVYKTNFLVTTLGREFGRNPQEDARAIGALGGLISYLNLATGDDQIRAKALVKQIALDLIAANGENWVYKSFNSQKRNVLRALVSDAAVIPRGNLIMNKIFPIMNRMLNYRNNWGLVVSYYDTQMHPYEDGGENKKGWNLTSGMVYIYNNDRKVFSGDVWPTINAYRLPGITTVANSTNPTGNANLSFGGGATLNNLYGTLAYNLKPNNSTGLNANKSYFAFDNEVVCVGSNISATVTNNVESIIENRMINDAGNNRLTVDGTNVLDNLGNSGSFANPKWANLAGTNADADIGYYFPQAMTINARRVANTGKWSDVANQGSTDPITKNYVEMWVDHGSKPASGGYAWVILPGMTPQQTAQYSLDPKIEILSSTDKLHAVHQKELNIFAFNSYSNESLTAGPITTNKIASVIMQKKENTTTIAVSDPTRSASSINVTISGFCGDVVSKDSNINVTSIGENLSFTVNTQGSQGKTFSITVSNELTGVEGEQSYDYTDGQLLVTTPVKIGNAKVEIVDEPNVPSNKVMKISEDNVNSYFNISDNFNTGISSEWALTNDGTKVSFSTEQNQSGSNSGSLRIQGKTTATRTFESGNYLYEIWMYDPGKGLNSTGLFNVGPLSVGIYSGVTANNYVFRSYSLANTANQATSVVRSQGWHKITVDNTVSGRMKAYIDDFKIYDDAGATDSNQAGVYDWWGAAIGNPVYFDDLSIASNSLIIPKIKVMHPVPFLTTYMNYEAKIKFNYTGAKEIDVFSIASGLRMVAKDGKFYVYTGDSNATPRELFAYIPDTWYTVSALVDTNVKEVSLSINGTNYVDNEALYDSESSIAGALYHELNDVTTALFVDDVKFISSIPEYELQAPVSDTASGSRLNKGQKIKLSTLPPTASIKYEIYEGDGTDGVKLNSTASYYSSFSPFDLVPSAQKNMTITVKAWAELIGQESEASLFTYTFTGVDGSDTVTTSFYANTVSSANLIAGIRAGTIVVKAANNLDSNFVYFGGLYEDNALIDVKMLTSSQIDEGDTLTFNVPNNDSHEYKICTYVWDSAIGMNPKMKVATLKRVPIVPNASGKYTILEAVGPSIPSENPPSFAINGNINDRWAVPGYGPYAVPLPIYLTLDLGGVVPVNRVAACFYLQSQRQYLFDIQLSIDGVTWSDPVYKSELSSPLKLATELTMQNFDFPLQDARYVRFNCKNNSASEWNSYSEVEVYYMK